MVRLDSNIGLHFGNGFCHVSSFSHEGRSIMGLLRAIETIPTPEQWLLGIVLLTVYASIALVWGFKSNFLKFQLLKSPLKINQIVVSSFFTPALIEEIVFRVLLLPRKAVSAGTAESVRCTAEFFSFGTQNFLRSHIS